MARSSARSLFAALGTAVALTSIGCFDTSSNVTSGEYPTILTVDPALFRGLLPCGAPGLVSYVATLTDLNERSVLPSTKPVACYQVISFGEPRIAIGHQYIGAIDGYDREGIEPESAGSRTMVDSVTKDVVLPRWSTTCGDSRVVVGDGGSDAEADAAPPSLWSQQGDAGADADAAAPYNYLRAPTQVLWKEEVILRGCYPLGSVLGPDASAGDAGNDATIDAETPPDASIDQEPPDGGAPGEDAESDAGDGATTEDGAEQG